MAKVPAVTPDGAKILHLIRDGGWSIAGFARRRLRHPAVIPEKTLYAIVYCNQRTSIERMRQIAEALGVEAPEGTEPYQQLVLAECPRKAA